MTYYIYEDGENRWSWCLLTSDRKRLALAGERYDTQQQCLSALADLKLGIDSPIAIVERETAAALV
jgi:uncharacterized protein YegP (UPF0339 family)